MEGGAEYPRVRRAVPKLGPSASEVEEFVAKLAKEGHSTSEIGILLRDQHGVPSVKQVTGKSIAQILSAQGVETGLPEDLVNLIKKAVMLHKHIEKNKDDQPSRRSLGVVEARIQKLAKYYVKNGKLPKDWRYESERAALLVR